jgi:hypothetical protein
MVGSKEQKVEKTGRLKTKDKVITTKDKVVTTVEVVIDTKDEIEDDAEEDAISRLEAKEQEHIQEQEETRSAVLGENNTGNNMEELMERMMERKMKVRFEQMETDWKQKQTASIDRYNDAARAKRM